MVAVWLGILMLAVGGAAGAARAKLAAAGTSAAHSRARRARFDTLAGGTPDANTRTVDDTKRRDVRTLVDTDGLLFVLFRVETGLVSPAKRRESGAGRGEGLGVPCGNAERPGRPIGRRGAWAVNAGGRMAHAGGHRRSPFPVVSTFRPRLGGTNADWR
jgi:hypothetical protein